MTHEIKYGSYVKEQCCVDCDHAGKYKDLGGLVPPLPLTVCPKCGGRLANTLGRWKYSEEPVSWWEALGSGRRTKIIKHGFERGRELSATKRHKNYEAQYTKPKMSGAEVVTAAYLEEFNTYCADVMGYDVKQQTLPDGYNPYYNLYELADVVEELINLTGKYPKDDILNSDSGTARVWADYVTSTMEKE